MANNLAVAHSESAITSVAVVAAAVAVVTHKYLFELLTPGLVILQPFALVPKLPIELVANVYVTLPEGKLEGALPVLLF